MAYFYIFFVNKGFQMEPSVADHDQRQALADTTALNHAHEKVEEIITFVVIQVLGVDEIFYF
jgi:hypothetical protein